MLVTILGMLGMLGMYVGYVFLCRYLDIWVSRTELKHNFNVTSPTPLFWFTPVIGLVIVGLYAFATWTQVWRKTPMGEWFLGEKYKKI